MHDRRRLPVRLVIVPRLWQSMSCPFQEGRRAKSLWALLNDVLGTARDIRKATQPNHESAQSDRQAHRCHRMWHQEFLRRSEEHTSELQSRGQLVCRLLLAQKNKHHNTREVRPERL